MSVVGLRADSTVMRAQVVAYDKRLSCADPDGCARSEDFVFASYARLSEERRGILEDIRRRGRIHA